MTGRWFSFSRLLAVIVKEFIQMRRDRLTFAMMVGIPLMQLTLFGYAINTDPKHLPTVVLSYDQSDFTRSFIGGAAEHRLLPVVAHRRQPGGGRPDARRWARSLFAVTIPAGFSARPAARRPPAAAGRGRRQRPGRHRQRAGRPGHPAGPGARA